jgi:hypothetical protein
MLQRYWPEKPVYLGSIHFRNKGENTRGYDEQREIFQGLDNTKMEALKQ